MFTVGWVRSALDDLADIWTQADAGDRGNLGGSEQDRPSSLHESV
jgi:hypothetical protein